MKNTLLNSIKGIGRTAVLLCSNLAIAGTLAYGQGQETSKIRQLFNDVNAHGTLVPVASDEDDEINIPSKCYRKNIINNPNLNVDAVACSNSKSGSPMFLDIAMESPAGRIIFTDDKVDENVDWLSINGELSLPGRGSQERFNSILNKIYSLRGYN